MGLPSRSFSQLVQDMSAVVQGGVSGLIDLSAGSVLRAILEANAAVALWMQWLVSQVLLTTRAATSTGVDLDSWMLDFSVTRLPAIAATGTATFSRFLTASQAVIPAGTVVKTVDASQSFVVVTDTGHLSWSPASNGYLLPAGGTEVTVPLAAQSAGAAGNVLAGAIGLIASPLLYVDAVTNRSALVNGRDAESDDALRDRFGNFLASRSRATVAAVEFAIACLQQGMDCVVQENVDIQGMPRIGNFVVTIDDGSGAPATSLLDAARTAIERVRPIGSTFAVRPPSVTAVEISLEVAFAAGADASAAREVVTQAIASYVDSLRIGALLSATRIAQVVYQASPTVSNVRTISIAGCGDDYQPPPTGLVRASTISVL